MAPPACEAYNQATIAWIWDRKALMTDYYPLIADAVADLDKNTGDARGASANSPSGSPPQPYTAPPGIGHRVRV